MKKLIRSIGIASMLGIGGCNALFLCGCQTAAEIEKLPETALPIQTVVEVNGVQQLATTGYQMAGGGWRAKVRSPLWSRDQLDGFSADIQTNGTLRVSLNRYEKDLSTNAVIMVRNIFDGSANLALAVAKAYATISTGGATDATSALVTKVVNYFKSRGGDPSKSTVTADSSAGKITVTDGTTAICCDADGNCSACTPTP